LHRPLLLLLTEILDDLQVAPLKTFAFLLLPVALASAQNRQDARDLLSRADTAIFSARTVRLAATQSQGFVGSQLPGAPFKIEFVRGGKGRAEYGYPASRSPITLMVFDGAYLWEYHDLTRRYTKNTASAWTFQGEIETIDYGRRSANILTASYQTDETLDFRGTRVDCYVVLAKYSRAPGLPLADSAIRRVWISKDSELILRDYWEGAESFSTVKRTVTTNYTDIETGIPLSDDLFVFQPPPGSIAPQPESPIERSKDLTADGAAELEKSLAADSRNIASRLTLMWYYAAHNGVESHLSQLRHIEWMIEHHPDSELFQGGDAKLQPFFRGPAFKAELNHAEELWLRAVDASHDDPKVLDNAQNSLYWVDPAACIRYMMRLRRAEPANPEWVIAILRVYAGLSYEDPKVAAGLAQSDIEPSGDLAVTGCIGQLLFGVGSARPGAKDVYQFAALGEKLLRKAQAQDPASWRWVRTLTVLPGMVNSRPMLNNAANNAAIATFVANWIQNSLRQEDLWPGRKVPGLSVPAAALLIDPSDMPAPAPIPIDGIVPRGDVSVRLQILIGKDGAVEKVQYIAGLAALAQDAVHGALQWKLPPRRDKDRAVEAVLQIEDTVTRAAYQPTSFSPGIPGGFGTLIGGGVFGGIIGGFPGPPPPSIDPGLVAAQLVRRVEPLYPAAAKNSGVKGTVRFRATLGEDGAITSLQLVNGHPMLVNAARTALSQWLYNPWIVDGKPVEIGTTIDVDVK